MFINTAQIIPSYARKPETIMKHCILLYLKNKKGTPGAPLLRGAAHNIMSKANVVFNVL